MAKNHLLVIFLFLIALAMPVQATLYNSTQNGNWTDVSTWGGSGYPQGSDNATIYHNIRINTTNNIVSTVNITSNGTLTMDSGTTLTLNSSIAGNGILVYGNLTTIGTSASRIKINASSTNFRYVVYNSGWHTSDYTDVVNTTGGTSSNIDGGAKFNNSNFSLATSYFYFSSPTANTYILNSNITDYGTSTLYLYSVTANTMMFENITFSKGLFFRNIIHAFFKNINATTITHYSENANNVSFFNLNATNLNLGNYENTYGVLYFNNSNLTAIDFNDRIHATNLYGINMINTSFISLTDNRYMTNKSYLVSSNTNNTNDWYYWSGHNNSVISYINLSNINYTFDATHDVIIMSDRLMANIDADMNTLNITSNGTYEITNSSISSGNTITDIDGNLTITSGSINGFTITPMNSTKAWFYNSTNIRLNPWTSLPEDEAVTTIGKAVNISNTSVTAMTNLRIYYDDVGSVGLTESRFVIAKYNDGIWTELDSDVDTENNFVYSTGIDVTETALYIIIVGGIEYETTSIAIITMSFYALIYIFLALNIYKLFGSKNEGVLDE